MRRYPGGVVRTEGLVEPEGSRRTPGTLPLSPAAQSYLLVRRTKVL